MMTQVREAARKAASRLSGMFAWWWTVVRWTFFPPTKGGDSEDDE